MFKTVGSLIVLSSFALTAGCSGSASKGAARSSDDEALQSLIRSADSEFDGKGKRSKKRYSYKPVNGRRMDHVEFLINQDLMLHGLDKEKRKREKLPKLKSIFASSGKTWQPRRKNTIPIARNQRVTRWVRYFSGPLRSNFARWLKRASLYGPIIEGILKEYKLPPDLIYLAMIESGFNLNAYSHAHAAGPWQFIGATGRRYGLSSGGLIDERRDLIKATHSAARHLRDLYRRYGDWYLSFAAYNSGAGTVNRAIKRGKSRNYWRLSGSRSRHFRQETKDYVPRILAAALVAKNYRKYGFSRKLFQKPLSVEVVTVPDATDMEVLAYCAGVSQKEMEFLNPSLVLGITPPGQRYRINVPRGTGELFRQNYARVPKKKRAMFALHKVRKKETVYKIARRYKVPAKKLARVNRLSLKTKLKPGRYVKVPKRGRRSLAKLFKKKGRKADKNLIASTAPTPSSVEDVISDDSTYRAPVAPSTRGRVSSKKHTVKRGESLGTIARKYRVKVASLKRWNGLKGTSIKAGQVIKVSAGRAPAPSSTASAKAKTYRVQAGDTLGGIARKHRVRVRALQNWNKLGKKDVIRIGQVLKVSAPSKKQPVPASTSVAQATSSKKYRVKSGDTLGGIAQKHRVKVASLKKWNNLGRKDMIRVGQVLKVSASSKRSHTPSSKLVAKATLPGTYRVQPGDTLIAIAKKSRVRVASLKKWNKLDSDSVIKPGQVLNLVPTAVTSAAPVASSASAAPIAPATSQPQAAPAKPAVRTSTYRVQPGDTLGGVAQKHGMRLAAIKSLNGLDSDRIKAGQALKVTGRAKVTKAPPSKKPRSKERLIIHAVRNGETLWDLARKYGVTVSQLKKWNGLKSEAIRPNQKIKIYAIGKHSPAKKVALVK